MMTWFRLRVLAFFALICAVLSEWSVNSRPQHWPRFLQPLKNITVPVGREATFTCHIANLGPHKVAWIKSDNQAILSINDKVISDYGRLTVVRNDVNTWTMTLRGVQRTDSGTYMCQVNTDPVQVQVGELEVVVPPDIESSATSTDVDVPEGGSARLQCRARGHPPPIVSWRREDGRDITLRQGRQVRVHMYTGETLHLTKLTRADMGVYLCIANNGIPPVVSKRTMVSVQFAPSVLAENGLIGTPLGSDITITCHVEASPKPIYYWAAANGDMLLSGARHQVLDRQISGYRHEMTLLISDVTSADFRPYLCVAKNAVGEGADRVDLHEIVVPARSAGEPRRRQEAWPSEPDPVPTPDSSGGDGSTRRRGPRLPADLPPAPAEPPRPGQQTSNAVSSGAGPALLLVLLIMVMGAGRLR